MIAHRNDILLRNQEVSQYRDYRRTQRVRFAIQMRHEHGHVRHRRLWHTFCDFTEESTDTTHADSVAGLLQLVIMRIDAPNLANKCRREVRVFKSISRRAREFRDWAGQMLALVQ